MIIHPLQRAYKSYIISEYGFRPAKMPHPEEKAMAVRGLGLEYEIYVMLACCLLEDWSIEQGWKYPYWNVVMSSNTVGRIKKLLDLGDVLDDDNYEFGRELAYAEDYISWFRGLVDVRPKRLNGGVDSKIRVDVAMYICDVYGVEYNSPNYNDIAASIERRSR